MAGIEIVSIVAIVVAGAILIPIVFDENPAAFLENGLCVIFTGSTNTTCNAIKGNVTFVGIPPITVIANNSINTIFWNFTGEAVITNQTQETHTNVGGGAEVFKNETAFNANFRTLTGGAGVTIIQNPETIEITSVGGTAQAANLTDVHFNAEEATVDDLTGLDCVNDITYSFFNNTDINEYRRQAIEFCADSDPDDNITWLYTVPQSYDVISPTDFKFRLFWTDDDTGAGAFMKRIDDDDDDAEEALGPLGPKGDMSLGSSDLEMHAENIVEADDNDFLGLRWTDVLIPNGATILNATIQFHVDSENPDLPVVVRFKGHDIDNAPIFTTTDFDITSRTNTTAFVDWDIPDWVSTHDEGPAQLTPNLATIVQEIVDRPGWLSGNAMVIKTTEWPNATGTNVGERHAEAHDGESSSAAELSVSFTTGPGGNPPVCFEISIMAVANTEGLDGVFTGRETVCVNRSGTDNLSITEFDVAAVDHQFSAEDLVFLRIHRPDNFVPNDFESEVFVFGAELQWVV